MSEHTLEQIAGGSVIIGYTPFLDEPDYRIYLTQNSLPVSEYLVPTTKDVLPSEVGTFLKQKYAERPVVIFLPGRAFDSLGTRHGRGHGWYDRLLSNLPKDWVRVGVLNEAQFSEVPLVRQEWDQPVDFLLIQRGDMFEKRATGARPDVLKSYYIS
jgi:5,10-methenyltetrahydrofolate synthetase